MESEWAPLEMLRYCMKPHHVAQVVNTSPIIYRSIFLRHSKNTEHSNNIYCILSECCQKYVRYAPSSALKLKVDIMDQLLKRYEAKFIGEIMIIRKKESEL